MRVRGVDRLLLNTKTCRRRTELDAVVTFKEYRHGNRDEVSFIEIFPQKEFSKTSFLAEIFSRWTRRNFSAFPVLIQDPATLDFREWFFFYILFVCKLFFLEQTTASFQLKLLTRLFQMNYLATEENRTTGKLMKLHVGRRTGSVEKESFIRKNLKAFVLRIIAYKDLPQQRGPKTIFASESGMKFSSILSPSFLCTIFHFREFSLNGFFPWNEPFPI